MTWHSLASTPKISGWVQDAWYSLHIVHCVLLVYAGAVGFNLWRNWDYGVFTVKVWRQQHQLPLCSIISDKPICTFSPLPCCVW